MELKFISLLGWPAMLLLAWAVSYNRKKFPWRTVLWGLGLQFTLAHADFEHRRGAKRIF